MTQMMTYNNPINNVEETLQIDLDLLNVDYDKWKSDFYWLQKGIEGVLLDILQDLDCTRVYKSGRPMMLSYPRYKILIAEYFRFVQNQERLRAGEIINSIPDSQLEQYLLQIDTKNILFICGGAFVGLDKIIEKRQNKNTLGFNAEEIKSEDKKLSQVIKEIQPQDLIKFGLIPEFVGRLPIVVGLDELTEDALVKIMTEPKNALVKQYKTMFHIDGVNLEIQPDAVRAVAKKAMKLKTGARGLRTIMEDIMLDIMFVTPDDRSIKKVIVSEETVKTKEPIIERKEDEQENSENKSA